MLAWSSGSGVKMGNKRNRNNFINVNGFIKKRKKQVSVIVEIILEIFKNFCQRELLMCYHVGISPLGGLVDSFSQLYFTINLEEIFYFATKNAVFMRRLAFRKHIITLILRKELYKLLYEHFYSYNYNLKSIYMCLCSL